MNERIKLLAEQCTTINDSTTIPVDKDFDYEKFAELIVRECANICYGFSESGDGYTCSAEVLEHFGVEE